MTQVSRTILITGVRGKTGRTAAAALAGRPGVTIRGGSSDPARVREPGVVPIAFDWDRPETWAPAVDGADAIYIVRPDLEHAPELVAGLVAATSPTTRLTLLSEQDAEHLQGWAPQVEEAVVSSGRPWTLLRPSWFQDVLTDDRYFRPQIAEEGRLAMPTGRAAIAWIDARDIGAVAAAALTEEGHDGRAYTLTGPAALTLEQVAETVATAAGRPVEAVEVDTETMTAGMDPWFAGMNAEVYDRVRAARFAPVTDDVERVTGAPARTLQAFAAEHAAAWAPASSPAAAR